MWLIFFLALSSVFLSARDIPCLDPKHPEFHWMDQLIEKDFAKLEPFTIEELEEAKENINKNRSNIVLRVKDNRVFGPSGAGKSMLEFLALRYKLPDLTIIYHHGDGLFTTPLGKVPVFTGARAKGVKNSILFVDWYFNINKYAEWNKLVDVIDNKLKRFAWDQRIPLLFWRGTPSDITWPIQWPYTKENWFLHARGKVCFLALQFPDLIDAQFTNMHKSKRKHDFLKYDEPVSIEHHLEYKYQLQVTGAMANYPRDRWQFYSESAVFRHPPPHEMFWYDLVEPWVHYIPVESDFSDLVEKILWAKQNDAECQEIAKRGREFALTHFMPEHIALYCYKALLKYVSLIQ